MRPHGAAGQLLRRRPGRDDGSAPRRPRPAPVTAEALASLLHPGGRRSWENPELTSLNRLPARATLGAPRPARALARRRLGVQARQAARRRDARRPSGGRLGHGAGSEPLDDARLRHPEVHERRDAVPGAAPARARGESDGHLPALLRDPACVGRAADRARLRRHRGRAPRRAERSPGRHREGFAHARRVRRHRSRAPQRPERARRRRRALVRRKLRRGPGPVVACGHLAFRQGLGGGLHPGRVRPRRGRRAAHRRRRGRRRRRGGGLADRPARARGARRAVLGAARSAHSRTAPLVGRGADALHPRRERRRRDGLAAASGSARSRCATDGCSSTAGRC